ncbi:cobalamin biosynthesis protein CbiL [Ancylobacter amanitiformis]|uniref:Nickel transport protein n=1 Tax=Ancylobacter amanitiformis TaxID=217069 RepID=A0ABU0LMS8_9HYPH|nr:cobalamin biosynthesis protein CbiL [Ancylobacter amanitiformis]MDQ0509908.1 nickel transport protein [Ancylobacter amanitiformis]
MSRLLLTLLILPGLAGAAEAHKLKVFAAVEGEKIGGYAFFIGGGRPQGVPWTAKNAQGVEVASGLTDAEGRFSFARPATIASDLTITVDTREAHIASTTLPVSRLGGAAAPPATPAASATGTPAPPLSDTRLAALVEAAVQRQVEPLEERIEAMDSRLRFVDALSGVFLILGLGGMALWEKGRRR